jgi:hypothetical protein
MLSIDTDPQEAFVLLNVRDARSPAVRHPSGKIVDVLHAVGFMQFRDVYLSPVIPSR